MRAPDRFGTLVAAGITTWLGVQAFVNIGGVTGMIPIINSMMENPVCFDMNGSLNNRCRKDRPLCDKRHRLTDERQCPDPAAVLTVN